MNYVEEVNKYIAKGIFAFDTETTGKDPRVATATAASLYHPEVGSLYIPVTEIGRENWNKICQMLFSDKKNSVLMWNAPYDMEIVTRGTTATWTAEVLDVQCAAWNLYGLDLDASGIGKPPSLKRSTLRHLGREVVEFGEAAKAGLHSPKFKQYAIDDVINTWDLWDFFKERMDSTVLANTMLDSEFQNCIVDMQQAGFELDRKWLRDRQSSNKTTLLNMELKLRKKFKGNLNSRKQVAPFIFDTLNVTPPWWAKNDLKKDGYPAIGGEVLKASKGGGRWLKTYLEYKILTKEQTGFIKPLLKMDSSTVTSLYMSCGMKSSRISSRDRNLQNLPRGDVKAAFRAPEGRLLVCADYSQAEIRVNAHLTRDPKLLGPIKRGEKIYDVYSKEWDMSYDDAKTVILALQYGLGANTFSRRNEVPINTAKRWHQQYHDTFIKVHQYMDLTKYMCTRQKRIDSPVGRYRIIDPHLRRKHYHLWHVALNFPAQTTVGHMIRLAMVAFRKEKKSTWRMVNQVHDEVVADCPEGEVLECETVLKECMEVAGNSLGLCVPITAEVGHGRTWKEAKA